MTVPPTKTFNQHQKEEITVNSEFHFDRGRDFKISMLTERTNFISELIQINIFYIFVSF